MKTAVLKACWQRGIIKAAIVGIGKSAITKHREAHINNTNSNTRPSKTRSVPVFKATEVKAFGRSVSNRACGDSGRWLDDLSNEFAFEEINQSFQRNKCRQVSRVNNNNFPTPNIDFGL